MAMITNDKYCVYAHINKINGKIYIGQTHQKPSERWKKGLGYIHSTYFYSAIQKYGWDNFDHEIVASNLTLNEANHFEELLISKLDTTDKNKGYNLKSGGQNNLYSETTKQKMSNAQKGKHHSKETKQKLSKAHKGKKLSKETRQKMSKSRIGKANWKSKKVAQYDLEGNLVKVWDCTMDVYRELSDCPKSISSCCLGKIKTTGGYMWRYVNEDICNKIPKYIPYSSSKHKNSQKVNQYTKDGKFVRTWDCMKDVERELTIYQANISKVCRGELKSSGGFIWRYADTDVII